MSRADSIFKAMGSWGRPAAHSGKAGTILEAAVEHAQAIQRGKKIAAGGGAVGLGLGLLGRSSGSRGLAPKSSAPPPMDPYRQAGPSPYSGGSGGY